MYSLCMDAVDDKSVQPIKVSLVAALLAPFVIEMRVCLLRPASGYGENTGSVPQAHDPTGKLCRQVFPVEAEHALPHDCVLYT